MLKHIVMWRFLDFAEGHSKAENILIIKERLEGLKNKIPQIIKLEVGVSATSGDFDALLYSEFNSFEDLNVYKNHPLHIEISEFCSKVRSKRVSFDYITDDDKPTRGET